MKFKQSAIEREALFMTLFQGSDWKSVQNMPVGRVNDLLNWRIKYEEDKQKRVNEEVNKQKGDVRRKKEQKSNLNKKYGG